MTTKSDPLVATLAGKVGARSGTRHRVEALFSDRPHVLDAIREARRRKVPLSYGAIAKVLSADGDTVSEAAVRNWCIRENLP